MSKFIEKTLKKLPNVLIQIAQRENPKNVLDREYYFSSTIEQVEEDVLN